MTKIRFLSLYVILLLLQVLISTRTLHAQDYIQEYRDTVNKFKPLNDTIPPDTLELYLTNDPFKNKDISIFGKIYLSINSK